MPQRISASFQEQNLSVIAWVKADDTAVELNFLNEMGTNIGELFYSNEKISFSSNVLPASIKPEYIIADFQLCFYNSVLVAEALKNCGLKMETNGSISRIFNKNNTVYEIIKNPGTVRLINHLRGYTYIIEGDFN